MSDGFAGCKQRGYKYRSEPRNGRRTPVFEMRDAKNVVLVDQSGWPNKPGYWLPYAAPFSYKEIHSSVPPVVEVVLSETEVGWWRARPGCLAISSQLSFVHLLHCGRH